MRLPLLSLPSSAAGLRLSLLSHLKLRSSLLPHLKLGLWPRRLLPHLCRTASPGRRRRRDSRRRRLGCRHRHPITMTAAAAAVAWAYAVPFAPAKANSPSRIADAMVAKYLVLITSPFSRE